MGDRGCGCRQRRRGLGPVLWAAMILAGMILAGGCADPGRPVGGSIVEVRAVAPASEAHRSGAVNEVGATATSCDDDYRPPISQAPDEGFREDHGRYGPGNRGLSYRGVAGTAVEVMAPGRVVFAGPVAGRLVVTVVHPDRLRSAYTGLERLDVARGEQLEGCAVIGVSTAELQVSIRAGDAYLDPAVLLAARPEQPTVRLVDVPAPSARSDRSGTGRRDG